MSTYHWNFAFNMSAVTQSSNGVSTAYLQNGFAVESGPVPGEDCPATPVNLAVQTSTTPGDVLRFYLFDTTPASFGANVIDEVSITFAPALNTSGAAQSPLSMPSISGVTALETMTTSLFGEGGTSYPAWSIGGETNVTSGYTIVNAGSFLMTATVKVTNTTTSGTITFTVDPEMVTGAWG